MVGAPSREIGIDHLFALATRSTARARLGRAGSAPSEVEEPGGSSLPRVRHMPESLTAPGHGNGQRERTRREGRPPGGCRARMLRGRGHPGAPARGEPTLLAGVSPASRDRAARRRAADGRGDPDGGGDAGVTGRGLRPGLDDHRRPRHHLPGEQLPGDQLGLERPVRAARRRCAVGGARADVRGAARRR